MYGGAHLAARRRSSAGRSRAAPPGAPPAAAGAGIASSADRLRPVAERSGSVTLTASSNPITVARSSRRTPVLILARDPVLAALLGIALGLGDLEPVFAEPGERPDDAIARLRPPFVVLLDGEMDEAESDLFHARCARRGARVVLFAAPQAGPGVVALARARGLAYIEVPGDDETLRTAVHAARDAAPSPNGER
jgi:hypothetical protein